MIESSFYIKAKTDKKRVKHSNSSIKVEPGY